MLNRERQKEKKSLLKSGTYNDSRTELSETTATQRPPSSRKSRRRFHAHKANTSYLTDVSLTVIPPAEVQVTDLFGDMLGLLKFLKRVDEKGRRGEIESKEVKQRRPVPWKSEFKKDTQFVNDKLPGYMNLPEYLMLQRVHKDEQQFKNLVQRETTRMHKE